MKIEGITGGVQTAGFEGQIELMSLQWGVGRAISGYTGSARNPSSPSLSEITISKVTDSASMALARNATFGDAIPTIEINLTRDKGGGDQEAYMTITLDSVLVSGFSISSGGDFPSESVSLNYLKMAIHETWRATDYAEGGSDDFKFDLTTMKPF
jgi:type VI secretion system secreted protein Hcp